ncbi:hypothetical protein Agub_g12648 [Astrephomene gubernaculifera]|uniref:CCHC-type domain-containing protein n=1 Tax=Astrephomene gubernaculifera TaxID=47775 RepID=A0AAD3DYZ7_9CHLO|nr:hypothetical protein Agub_g12648 [Astrephomene gubernaculifera]
MDSNDSTLTSLHLVTECPPAVLPHDKGQGVLDRGHTIGEDISVPRQSLAPTLAITCSNVPDVAKRELEAFLLEWCQRHVRPAPGDSQQQHQHQPDERGEPQPQAQQPPDQPEESQGRREAGRARGAARWGPAAPVREDTAAGSRPAAAPSAPLRYWSGALSLTLPLQVQGQTQAATLESQQGRGRSSAEACGHLEYVWEDRLRPHSEPRVGCGLQRKSREHGNGDTGMALGGEAKSAAADGGQAGDNHASTNGSSSGSCVATAASAPQSAPQVNINAAAAAATVTMRHLHKPQATSAAVAFNVAFDQENNTPAYDRLRIAPLLLGVGLAASAVTPMTAPPPAASGAATHGSQEAPSALVTALIGSPAAKAGAADDNGANQRPRKRRRTEAEGSGGGGGGGGGGGLGQFSFVLNRCWNCGSYGHEIAACPRPRDQAAIDTHRRAFTESRAATAALRAARQAAGGRLRARRMGPSEGRYFSTAAPANDGEEAPLPSADGSNGANISAIAATFLSALRDGPLTVAPAWARPGVLSKSLATALGMESPLDPPPWLTQMALYGMPPAYCREGCVAELPPLPAPLPPQPAAPSGLPVIRVYGADGEPLPLPSEGEDGHAAGEDGASVDELSSASTNSICAERHEDHRAEDMRLEDAGTFAAPAPALGAAEMDVTQEGPSIMASGDEVSQVGAPQDLLLPSAPKHVSYPGVNASVPQAACSERWSRALSDAKRVAALVHAAKEAAQRRQQQQGLQQQGLQQAVTVQPHLQEQPPPPPPTQLLQGQLLPQGQDARAPTSHEQPHASSSAAAGDWSSTQQLPVHQQQQLQQQQAGCGWPDSWSNQQQQQQQLLQQQAAHNAYSGSAGWLYDQQHLQLQQQQQQLVGCTVGAWNYGLQQQQAGYNGLGS